MPAAEDLMARPGPGGSDDPERPPPAPKPVPGPPPPPFRPASYTFRLVAMQVINTRSAHLDSDKVGFAVAVGDGAPVTRTKDMGNVNNGSFPIGLSIGPILVSDPNIGIAVNYTIINSGYKQWADMDRALAASITALARAGARAATASAMGIPIGATIGTDVLPVIGSVLQLAYAFLVSSFSMFFTVDCDGPVAAEQAAFKGSQLWADTVGGSFTHTTYHPGADSPHGCGSNSAYTATWSITRQ